MPVSPTSWKRQPIHTVYGGAHLFTAATCTKLGDLARKSFADHAATPKILREVLNLPELLTDAIYERVQEKLAREPIEDFRIDFEDGFGIRSDADEDAAADHAGRETAAAMTAGTLPAFFGIRIKPLNEALGTRARRTLDIYLTALLLGSGGYLPNNFVVTLPKVTSPSEVEDLVGDLHPYGPIGIEIMVETPQALPILPQLVEAARGACTAAHFGAYDYTASLGLTSVAQNLLHPACDYARMLMLTTLAPTGVWLSDGATNTLPILPHRGKDLTSDQLAENSRAIHAAWKLHYNNTSHALNNGFYQGWDLHPAQIPARYAAVHAFFLEGMEQASSRLRNFVEMAAQATHVRGVFDDAATGQGLLNFFLRAINCGAIREAEIPELTGLSLEELRTGSFTAISQSRAKAE
ncbi:MAG: phosphoenolpyruvate kinase [Acidobacteriota bacterium]